MKLSHRGATLSTMGLKITTLGIEVTGRITKTYDEGANKSSLVVNQAQARELYDTLGVALDFFDAQAGVPVVSP